MDWHGYTAVDEARRNYLEHYGKKGMKWGKRKSIITGIGDPQTKINSGVQQSTSSNVSLGQGGSMVQNAANAAQNTATSNTSQVAEMIHPNTSYKEAKKSKKFSFISDIISRIKKFFS